MITYDTHYSDGSPITPEHGNPDELDTDWAAVCAICGDRHPSVYLEAGIFCQSCAELFEDELQAED